MIYTDGTHLISDTSLDELHEFAERIGMHRDWFQGERPEHPHYDLFGIMKKLALDEGAIMVRPRDIVRMLKVWMLKGQQ